MNHACGEINNVMFVTAETLIKKKTTNKILEKKKSKLFSSHSFFGNDITVLAKLEGINDNRDALYKILLDYHVVNFRNRSQSSRHTPFFMFRNITSGLLHARRRPNTCAGNNF